MRVLTSAGTDAQGTGHDVAYVARGRWSWEQLPMSTSSDQASGQSSDEISDLSGESASTLFSFLFITLQHTLLIPTPYDRLATSTSETGPE